MKVQMPTEAIPAVVINGDCWDVLKALPDGSVDHAVSDPPYSEKTHAGARTNRASTGVGELIDFQSISGDRFVELCRELTRVAKRWVLLTCDWRHAALLEDAMPQEFVRLGVWIKPNGMPQVTGDRPATGWEAVAILHRAGRKRWNRGGHHAVWTHNKPQNPQHPTEKPLALIRNWLRDFTDPNEIVLDPFAGSGTTALACLYEGRRTIAVELDAKYIPVIRGRLAKVQGQALVPYTPPRPKAEAPKLF